jgi:hypothetical protein
MRRRPIRASALLGAHLRQAVAGQLALGGAVGLEGFARPDLEALAQADHRHPVGQAEHLAQGLGQGDAAGGVERQPAMPPSTLVSSAVRSGSPNGSSSMTPGVAVEQRLAAASRQSASMEGKQKTPSNGPAAARKSCGTTMRRLRPAASRTSRETPRPIPCP